MGTKPEENKIMNLAEYIWIDGSEPTQKLRSKTKVLPKSNGSSMELSHFPNWVFDGSSTNQAEGKQSDCLLKPVLHIPDPIRGEGCFLVLCEVLNPDGTPHESNTRTNISKMLENGAGKMEPWFGFEQEYTLYKGSRPLGFPSENRFPPAQGPYFCGIGADEVYGRPLVEAHLKACISAGIAITGVNAEVMPGQWEFQIGGPDVDGLTACDHLWLARYMLYRLGEDMEVSATLDAKPVPGNWNGAGMHTNFSTNEMRAEGGIKAIDAAIEQASKRVPEHQKSFGDGYEMRLTGHHETCHYDEFRSGVSDRTASIRIPTHVAQDGCGYLEDRRPNANADPYKVGAVWIETACNPH